MTQRNGIVVARKQCLHCGDSVAYVPKSTVSVSQLPPFDEVLRKRYSDERNEFWRKYREAELAAQEKAKADWWRQYNAYLLTPQWAKKRAAVLARDNYVCQGCRVNRATQAHHLTYKRVGREMLFDLIAVCVQCHEAIHTDEQADH